MEVKVKGEQRAKRQESARKRGRYVQNARGVAEAQVSTLVKVARRKAKVAR